ncbi:MAG TPA: PDZ domain-containing protein [Kofleriaceae bacterium]|nr:PDZ domain-containing protein [Kofleriaceae bacterium]
MASPNRGQWADNSGGDQSQPPQSYPSQGYGSQGSSSQGGYQPPSGYPSQGAQGNPSQGGYQDQGTSQDQEDEDIAETEGMEANQSHLGVMVMAVTPELRRFFGVASDRGVLVARVEPGSAAARAGVQVGDVLVRVGPQVVHTGDDVIQALAARPGGRIRIAVVRQAHPIHLVAFLPSPNQVAPGNQQGPQQGPQQNNQPPSASQSPL